MHTNREDGGSDIISNMTKWKKWLGAIAVMVVGSYFLYFGLLVGLPRALDPDKWGTFGDFVGGIMNPIVAFAAFYWLTESVKLQKQELAETRAELKAAADAQRELVENGRDSIRLAALTAVINEIRTRTDLIKETEESFKAQFDGLKSFDPERAAELQKEIRNASRYRVELNKDWERYFWDMRCRSSDLI